MSEPVGYLYVQTLQPIHNSRFRNGDRPFLFFACGLSLSESASIGQRFTQRPQALQVLGLAERIKLEASMLLLCRRTWKASNHMQQHLQQLHIVSTPFIQLETPCTSPSSAACFKISLASSLLIFLPSPFSIMYSARGPKWRQVSVVYWQSGNSGSRFFRCRHGHTATQNLFCSSSTFTTSS
jgi:hypothetical protein